MERRAGEQPKIRLYVDSSLESWAVCRILEERGTEYSVVYASTRIGNERVMEVPALETMFGRIEGFWEISKHFFTPEEMKKYYFARKSP